MTGDSDQKLTQMKVETKKLFDQMRHIMQAQAVQMQSCMRDFERLDSQIETLRTTYSSKGDNDMDLAKKIIHLDRDFG